MYVCMSVCPSGAVSKRMDTSSHFLTFGRASLLFLRALPPLQNSKGNPLSGGVKCTGWENFANVALFSRKRYEIGPYSVCDTNKVADDHCQFK